jgi:HAD superfamily hydrolase (TIGR01549 family)
MPFDASRVRAICFDVDGTLSDTDDKWVAQIEDHLRGLKLFMSETALRRLARWMVMASETPSNAIYHWMDALSLDDHIASLYERMVQRQKQIPHTFWLMAEARETLTYLAGKYPLSVVSARDELTTQSFMEQFALGVFFEAVATSQTCTHTKPYPAPVLWAAARMAVPAQNCLMVGDTTVDILAGRAAGAQTLGLLCGFGTERELKRAGADLILQELRELPNYL